MFHNRIILNYDHIKGIVPSEQPLSVCLIRGYSNHRGVLFMDGYLFKWPPCNNIVFLQFSLFSEGVVLVRFSVKANIINIPFLS